MFLRLGFSELQGQAVKGLVNGKKVNFFIRLVVDETNIVEALDKHRGNKNVICYEYIGDEAFLRSVDIGSSIVVVIKDVTALDMGLDFIMNAIDPRVRVVFRLPSDYFDMRAVVSYGLRFPNSRFIGGNFINLPSSKLGIVDVTELNRKIPDSRIHISTTGEDTFLSVVGIVDVEELEFTNATVKVKSPRIARPKSASSGVSKPKAEPKKKRMSNLVSLSSTSGFDNF